MASRGLLEVRGTIDVDQFWPVGSADADTTKIRVQVGQDAFRFRKDGGSNFRVTRVFDDAKVKGKSVKDVVDKKGNVTVRLQGIDAPELHYRPVAELKVAKQSARQRELYLEWNLEYRQPLAESATVALSNMLRAGGSPLPCTVRSFVDEPNDVFDTYGRMVGEVFVDVGGGELSVNTWLAEQGWVLPAFYNSMSDDEIEAITRAANVAYDAELGVWAVLSERVGSLDFDLVYRGKNAKIAKDRGRVVWPKLFRRLAAYAVNERAGMVKGTFHAYLVRKKDYCFETDDFLEQGVAATVRELHEFVTGNGGIQAWPESLVFKDSPSTLIVPGGGPARW